MTKAKEFFEALPILDEIHDLAIAVMADAWFRSGEIEAPQRQCPAAKAVICEPSLLRPSLGCMGERGRFGCGFPGLTGRSVSVDFAHEDSTNRPRSIRTPHMFYTGVESCVTGVLLNREGVINSRVLWCRRGG